MFVNKNDDGNKCLKINTICVDVMSLYVLQYIEENTIFLLPVPTVIYMGGYIMKYTNIAFTKLNTAEYLPMDEIRLKEMEMGDNSVKVKTVISTISCGTEKANITGDLNVSIYEEPKPGDVAQFPRFAGYSSAGTVVEVGKNVKSVKVGDRVVVAHGGHRNYNVVDERYVVKIEDERVSFAEAAMAFIAVFPLAAVRKTRLELGESAMVVGLGILGQLAVQFAHAAGAVPVIAVDPVEDRRNIALKFGADYALDPTEPDFAKKVKEITGGGVNSAIEVTGLGVGLQQTLDCMAKFGRVALLGCTRDYNFTIDYYRKVHAPGIHIIGAHTMARPLDESYPGYFTEQDDMKAALKLCASNMINFKGLIAETHSPRDCGEVYTRLVNDRNFPIVVQFDWTQE